MDTTLLWIQGLALMLSATAFYVALKARLPRYKLVANAILYVLMGLTFIYLCLGAWAATWFAPGGGPLFFGSLAVLFLGGAIAIQCFGSRPAAPGLRPRALAWNWMWLLGIFAAVTALESIALHNTSISSEERIATALDKARAFAGLFNPPIPDAINAAVPESLAFDLLVRTEGKAAEQIDAIRDPASLDLTRLTQPELAANLESNRRPLALAAVAASRAGYFTLEESVAFPWDLSDDRASKVALLESTSRTRDQREIGRGKSRLRVAELLGARSVQRASKNDRAGAAQDLATLWGLERFHSLGPLPMHATELVLQTPGWSSAELQAIQIPDSPRVVEQLNRTLASSESEWSLFGLASDSAIDPGNVAGTIHQLFPHQSESRDPLDTLLGSTFELMVTMRGEYELKRSHELLDQLWEIAYLPPAGRTAALHTRLFTKGAISYETRWTREAMNRTLERETRRRLARTAVAFMRHRAESGKDVSTLNELVPAQLDAVPEDPYNGQPLKLTANAAGVVIYSVGPDGQDNQGKPLDDVNSVDSTGDLAFRLPARK